MARKIVRIQGSKSDILINKAKTALIKRDIHLGIGKIPAVGFEVLKALAEEFETYSINVTIVDKDTIVVSKKGARTTNGCIVLTDVPMSPTHQESALIEQRKQSVVNPTE